MGDQLQLPAAQVLRVAKTILPEGMQINKSAKEQINRAACIFALQLGDTASEFCKMGKRSTLNASDILKAVDDLELPGFADLLRSNLQAFKDAQAAKRKKPKTGSSTAAQTEGVATMVVDTEGAEADDAEAMADVDEHGAADDEHDADAGIGQADAAADDAENGAVVDGADEDADLVNTEAAGTAGDAAAMGLQG